MNTAIEGIYFKDLMIPFLVIMFFTIAVITITAILVRRELKNEEKN